MCFLFSIVICSLLGVVNEQLKGYNWWSFVCSENNYNNRITNYFAQGALVKCVGIDVTSTSAVGGRMRTYSLSAAFWDGFQFIGKMDPNRKC